MNRKFLMIALLMLAFCALLVVLGVSIASYRMAPQISEIMIEKTEPVIR